MRDDTDDGQTGSARPIWSGTVAFGLVSLPVSLYVANRRKSVSLRMLDQNGTPLIRQYFCSVDDQPLSREELVRGYEIERGEFIEVSDDELEALIPEKSREIDLRRFVPLKDVDPMLFERAYFLVPEEGAHKAYRLLAASMESEGRAGIATFIMRGKEYLVAIIAEHGILRAETLRFHDELRSPEDVGLPPLDTAPAEAIQDVLQAINTLATDTLKRSELIDWSNRQLLDLVERKLETGDDVLQAPEAPEPEGAEIIDLMAVLKKNLEVREESYSDKKAVKQKTEQVVDENMTRAELYELAKELQVRGRSQMSKGELLREVTKRSESS